MNPHELKPQPPPVSPLAGPNQRREAEASPGAGAGVICPACMPRWRNCAGWAGLSRLAGLAASASATAGVCRNRRRSGHCWRWCSRQPRAGHRPDPGGRSTGHCPAPAQLFAQTSADFLRARRRRSWQKVGLTWRLLMATIALNRCWMIPSLEHYAAPGRWCCCTTPLPLTESTAGGATPALQRRRLCCPACAPCARIYTTPAHRAHRADHRAGPAFPRAGRAAQPDSPRVRLPPSAHAVAHPQQLFNLGENNLAWLARWLANAHTQAKSRAAGRRDTARPQRPSGCANKVRPGIGKFCATPASSMQDGAAVWAHLAPGWVVGTAAAAGGMSKSPRWGPPPPLRPRWADENGACNRHCAASSAARAAARPGG